MDAIIWPPEAPVEATLRLPLSKSESNRLVIIRALTPGGGPSAGGLSDCDDTAAILAGVSALPGATVNVGPAGTAMRFLTAYFAAGPEMDVTLDGNERMRQRPIGPLVDALRQCGARIDYLGEEGFPPLHITGQALQGGCVEIDATVSSQFISALMMVAPAMEQGLTLRLRGEVASRPYIEMTARLMRRAGASVELEEQTVTVAHGQYEPTEQSAEGDWSAASYWFETAALSAGFVTLGPLYDKSLQGDSRIAELMKVTGLTTERTAADTLELVPTPDPGSRLIADMAATPDIAQTMAVTCCLLGIPFRLTGLQSLAIKETDRLAALQTELGKLGFLVESPAEGVLQWTGVRFNIGEEPEPIDTYDDHRMAMAFAPAAIFYPGLRIRGAQCVSKSYPRFWAHMESAGFTIEKEG